MTNRVLAASAVVLAAGALIVGGAGPDGGGPGTRGGVAELTAELDGGGAWMDPLELAARIRARHPLRLFDLRDSSAFIRLSLPTAEHARLAELAGLAEGAEDVVLYDDGSGAAVRGWLLLRRLGHPRVRVLRGGVLGWIDGVLSPVLPAGTAAEKAVYDSVAATSRYFGGVPRVGERPAAIGGAARTEEAVRLLSRRGCF